MNKPKWLKIVNLILFICILNQALTVVLHDLANKDVFEYLHPIGGIFTLLFAIIHMALNWAWIKANYMK